MDRSIPFTLPHQFVDRRKKSIESGEEFWFLFKEGKLLISTDTQQPFQTKKLPLARSLSVGNFKSWHLYAGETVAAELPAGAIWADLKTLHGKVEEALFALAGRALQLLSWDKNHQFCGQCGQKTIAMQNERAKECRSCNLLAFPRLSPAMMALIVKGDQFLLARGPQFPKGTYSVLAGFVDPGETLEQCVKREVFEEVGMHVDRIRYFGSQSWPFPHSLMIAFTCRWKSGEISIDPEEIEDAQWFHKGNLPPLPSELSIAHAMVNAEKS